MKKIFLLTGLLVTSLFLHSQILKKITDKVKKDDFFGNYFQDSLPDIRHLHTYTVAHKNNATIKHNISN